MPVFTNLSERQSYLDELPVDLGTTLSAVAQDALIHSPTSSIYRMGELAYANMSESSPLISAEDARKTVADRGMSLEIPDEGIRESALGILINRKDREARLNQIISHGPTGFGAGVAKLGAGFVAGLADPLNVAAAFIPVVNGARYTAMLDNASGPMARAMIRARVGAAEGVVGAAVVEPFVAAAAKYEQADYTMTNSLENIAFGGLFGGGLHMGVGALSDAMFRTGSSANAKPAGKMPQILNSLDESTRQNALHAALAQTLEGRQVNVDPILMYDPRYAPLKERLLMSTSLTQTPTVQFEGKGVSPFVELGQFGPTSTLRQEVRTVAPALDSRGEMNIFATFEEAERVQKLVERRQNEKLEIYKTDSGEFILRREFADVPVRDSSGNIFSFDTERAAKKGMNNIVALQGLDATPVPYYENGVVKYTLFEKASPEFIASAKKDPRLVSFDDTKVDRFNDTSMLKTTEQDQAARLQDAMRQAKEPTKSILANVESSTEATRYIEIKTAEANNVNAIDNEIADLMQRHADREIIAGADPEFQKTMAEIDATISDAEALGRGIMAAANCSLRRA